MGITSRIHATAFEGSRVRIRYIYQPPQVVNKGLGLQTQPQGVQMPLDCAKKLCGGGRRGLWEIRAHVATLRLASWQQPRAVIVDVEPASSTHPECPAKDYSCSWPENRQSDYGGAPTQSAI